MTLTPETRVMLTDALRPPAGFRVDIAVGTTYSLNLTALLLAPLSFALFDQSNALELEAEFNSLDPIRVFEAVRRYAERTTVFCQAGGIHVPTSYRSVFTYVEDCVFEVMPPERRTLFHPKIWALRFVDRDGSAPLHRLVILSRNMTLDRSWDTALVLDESPTGQIEAGPAAEFLRGLPGLCLPERSPSSARLSQLEDLATALSNVRLDAPSPFEEGQLLPIGLSADPVWPFPKTAQRVLAISPFLTAGAVAALRPANATEGRCTLVSTPEALEMVGGRALEGWSANVLQRQAEVDPDEDGADDGEAVLARTEFMATNEGLHAKTYVVDLPGDPNCTHKGKCRCRSFTVTGSANLTSSPWGRSVEFAAILWGPTGLCGVEATLEDRDDIAGLIRLLKEYSVASEAGERNARLDTSYEIEEFHKELAVAGPVLDVKQLADDRVEATLKITVPSDPPGVTRIWLPSLVKELDARVLGEPLAWTMAPSKVTPFIAVETTSGAGDNRVTRRCIIKATLSGDVDNRRLDAVAEILTSKETVLRYLVFLLGDPSYDALFAQIAGAGDERGSDRTALGFSYDVAIFEPLVRAAGRDEQALARVARLVEDIRNLPNGAELVPDGFDDLWAVVWRVHEERMSNQGWQAS